MPQCLSRILIHAVLSTKERSRAIAPEIQAELHPYLAGTLGKIGCPALQVGGVEDHVHLFFGLSRTRTIAEVVEMIKTSSSKWIKTKGVEFVGSIGKAATLHSPSANLMRRRSLPTSEIK